MVCEFSNVAFTVFGFPIHWYSFAYIIGIISALKLTEFLIKKSKVSIDIKLLDEFIGAAILGIIVGGRLGHVLFYDFDFYLRNPIEILEVWKGGMSFFGGFLGVLAASAYFCRVHKINFLTFMDFWSVGVPIGLFLGRVANFINGELLGKPCSNIPWAVVFKDGVLRHPSQIYEALLEGIVLFCVMLISFKKKQYLMRGRLCGIFCWGYGVCRMIGECFREPDSILSWNLYFATGLNLNQYFSLILISIGVVLTLHASLKYDSSATA